METKQKLWEILVPTHSNDGLEYTVEYHREWDKKVRNISGGLTIFEKAKGQWLDKSGRLYEENMIPVRIVCNDYNIETIIDETMNHYDQEAVLAYEVSSNVKLKHRSEK